MDLPDPGVRLRPDCLKIWLEYPLGPVVGMTDIIACHTFFPAY